MIKIRQARPEDANAVCAIVNPIIRDSLITFTTEERSTDGVAQDIHERKAAFLVAEIDKKIVGFATYGPFRNGPGYCFTKEHSIQLSASARGQGLGRGLMEHLEIVAVEQGVNVLVAGISSANQPGIEFHKALGFQQVGRMPKVGFKENRWLDLVLMQKNLSTDLDCPPDTARKPG